MSQASDDKGRSIPLPDKRAGLPDDLGRPDTVLAEAGSFSGASVDIRAEAGHDPLIAPDERPITPPSTTASPPRRRPLKTRRRRMRRVIGSGRPRGRALYAERKHTPEPAFGIVTSVLGFRQFSLRGLAGVHGE